MKELFDYDKQKKVKKPVEEIAEVKPVILKSNNSNMALVIMLLLGAVLALYSWYKNKQQNNVN